MSKKEKDILDSRERAKFRKTKLWLDFRAKVKKLKGNIDALTLKPLQKTFNLHHMDTRHENYENLEEDRFICLNRQSHDTIHFLYRYWVKDKDILKRLENILEEMEELSNDNKGKG